MSNIVERCPECGADHTRPGACGTCRSTLRPWCKRHSPEHGWLESSNCARCNEEIRQQISAVHALAVEQAAQPAAAPPPPPREKQRMGPFGVLILMMFTGFLGGLTLVLPGLVLLLLKGPDATGVFQRAVIFGVCVGALLGLMTGWGDLFGRRSPGTADATSTPPAR
jgi:hypothetical protein